VDRRGIAHLAEHGITPEDFENVVGNPTQQDFSHTSGSPAAFGYTDDGRYVIAIFDFIDDMTILPITAYEVPEPR
jgi:hypothetical protein